MDVSQSVGMLIVGTLLAFITIATCLYHSHVTYPPPKKQKSLPSARYVPLDVEPLLSSLQVSTDAVSLRYNEYEQHFGTYKSSNIPLLNKVAEKFDFLCL